MLGLTYRTWLRRRHDQGVRPGFPILRMRTITWHPVKRPKPPKIRRPPRAIDLWRLRPATGYQEISRIHKMGKPLRRPLGGPILLSDPRDSDARRTSALRQKLPLRISARRDCALSRGRPFRSPCRASENSSWGGPQNEASWPASTRASTICRRELLPLGPAPWQITSNPWGYTGKPGRAKRPYFTGLSRSHFKVAEREGFSPPIIGRSFGNHHPFTHSPKADCSPHQYRFGAIRVVSAN